MHTHQDMNLWRSTPHRSVLTNNDCASVGAMLPNKQITGSNASTWLWHFAGAARLNLHEAVANHFSVAVGDSKTTFLINPNQAHFSRIKASDLLLLDASDPDTLSRPNAPDPTAWGLHSAIHRHCPQARVALHVHPTYSTVLSTLKDPRLPPIDQNCAMFF